MRIDFIQLSPKLFSKEHFITPFYMALVRKNFVVIIMILFCIVATSKARNSLTLHVEKELSLENTPAIRKDLKVLPSPTNNSLPTEIMKIFPMLIPKAFIK